MQNDLFYTSNNLFLCYRWQIFYAIFSKLGKKNSTLIFFWFGYLRKNLNFPNHNRCITRADQSTSYNKSKSEQSRQMFIENWNDAYYIVNCFTLISLVKDYQQYPDDIGNMKWATTVAAAQKTDNNNFNVYIFCGMPEVMQILCICMYISQTLVSQEITLQCE